MSTTLNHPSTATDINDRTFEVGRTIDDRAYCLFCDHNPCECVDPEQLVADRLFKVTSLVHHLRRIAAGVIVLKRDDRQQLMLATAERVLALHTDDTAEFFARYCRKPVTPEHYACYIIDHFGSLGNARAHATFLYDLRRCENDWMVVVESLGSPLNLRRYRMLTERPTIAGYIDWLVAQQ
jgi:hypothetical protein